jgi:hypothetical protein
MMTDEQGAVSGKKSGRDTEKLGETCPSATYPPKIPHDLTRNRTRDASVGSLSYGMLVQTSHCTALIVSGFTSFRKYILITPFNLLYSAADPSSFHVPIHVLFIVTVLVLLCDTVLLLMFSPVFFPQFF